MSVDLEMWSTPGWAVRLLLEEVWLPTGAWIDPFAGRGNIIHAVCTDRPGQIHFTAVELRPDCRVPLLKLAKANSVHCPREFIHGFSPYDHRQLVEGASYFDVAITSPPASKVLDALPKCMCMAEHVVLLQPVNWLIQLKKTPDFLNNCPPDIYIIPNDIHSMTFAWFMWGPKASRFREKGSVQELRVMSPTELEE